VVEAGLKGVKILVLWWGGVAAVAPQLMQEGSVLIEVVQAGLKGVKILVLWRGGVAAVAPQLMQEGVVVAGHAAVAVAVLFEVAEIVSQNVSRAGNVIGTVFESSFPVRVVSWKEGGLSSVLPEVP